MKKFKNYLFLFVLILTLAYFVSCKYVAPTEPTLSKQGTLEKGTITSTYLGGATKDYYVYKPADYSTGDSFPVVYLLHGFGLDYTYFKDWTGIKHHLDELMSNGTIKEMIVVMPDGKNALGGSFFANSYDHNNNMPVFGDYEDYLISELIPTVEAAYKINTYERAIGGISMGGYGAMYLAEKHASMFKTVFSHSGPIVFDVIGSDTTIAAVEAENPDGLNNSTIETKLNALHPMTTMMFGLSSAFSPLITTWANSVTYFTLLTDNDNKFYLSPDPSGAYALGVELPINPNTTPWTLNTTVFNAWKTEFDPATLLGTYGANLATLNIYFDAGNEDELGMNYCAMYFDQTLTALSIPHTYEKFEGHHTDKLYQRLEVSLKFVSDHF